MGTTHDAARRELESFATDIAKKIVDMAFPNLKYEYDCGSEIPSVNLMLPGEVSRKIFDTAGGSMRLAEEIASIITERAKDSIKSRLGKDCKSVGIYRTDSARDLNTGDVWDLTVMASFT